MISPFYAQLSTKYSHVVFAKVDVDQLKEVAAACKVTSMYVCSLLYIYIYPCKN